MAVPLSLKIILGSEAIDQDFKDFLQAVEDENVEAMENFRGDINRRDSTFGATALHLAACLGKITSLEFLISHGADLNILTNDGVSALRYAAENDEADAFDLLVASGAEVGEITFGNESIPSTSPENGRAINATKFFGSRISQLGS